MAKRKSDAGDEPELEERDEKEVADALAAAHAEAEAKQLDTTEEGGRYIRGGRTDPKTGKVTGGEVVNAEGEVLATFDEDAENTGDPADGKRVKKK